jgi:hypothetical protein
MRYDRVGLRLNFYLSGIKSHKSCVRFKIERKMLEVNIYIYIKMLGVLPIFYPYSLTINHLIYRLM